MIVVKIGGRVIKNAFDQLIESILRFNGKLVLVHGGGDIVTEYTKRMGIEPMFVTSPEGIRSRYTSREELDIYVMVMGLINKNIVTRLTSKGKRTVGITGVDGGFITANRKKRIIIMDERGKKRIIDGGYTGKISQADPEILNHLLSLFEAVVISPIALDNEEGVPLNVDGDQMAFAVAKAARAEALLLLSDVDGVLLNGKVIDRLNREEARDLATKIGPGMNRKVLMASESIEAGVKRVIIGSGLIQDSINQALNGRGTVIS
ncbi:[LysW]-aminoadipate/[LysW]-glutamate kinase [Metallosphaera tengchongensis]|uniref:[LysW]-aminoadipate/[LysW]-glutamate kinase n=1 Tax=Metallosphaera tengchongensis TaxID=1532350 RepID=A0A6N0NV27_9CREN|nr:[LysW]-aminoadipate/[LysW]-glutamate kinase [Metallosphaera tengchongensis]QKR00035.1 [LysW]-aminoadipate/[LysW]-glutamate kinase [Metallosphaera tengchongensis]